MKATDEVILSNYQEVKERCFSAAIQSRGGGGGTHLDIVRGLSYCIIESHYKPRYGWGKLNLSSVFFFFFVTSRGHAAEI